MGEEVGRRLTTALLAVLLYVPFVASMRVQGSALRETTSQASQDGASQTGAEEDSAAIEEVPEPSDPQERAARRAKNIRYNIGGRDLTTLSPDEDSIEQVWPRVEFAPTSESAAIVTGTVIKLQPYLSENRSRIYTEIEIKVDDVLKRDANNDRLFAANTLVIDRLGGILKLKTGRIVHDDIHIDGLGKTRVGKRYIFFAERVNRGYDISLIKSYELRDGKVFTNDSRVSKPISTMPGVPETWAYEAAFLEAVRQEVRKEVDQSNSKNTGERHQQ